MVEADSRSGRADHAIFPLYEMRSHLEGIYIRKIHKVVSEEGAWRSL